MKFTRKQKQAVSMSCPALQAPNVAHVRAQTYNAYPVSDYYYYNESPDGSCPSSSTVVAGEVDTNATVSCKMGDTTEWVTDKRYYYRHYYNERPSEWLRRRRQYSNRNRTLLAAVGCLVLLMMVAAVVALAMSSFVFPKTRYTTRFSQSPRHQNATDTNT